jgi:transcriptional regulator with XRE-family HTH domain
MSEVYFGCTGKSTDNLPSSKFFLYSVGMTIGKRIKELRLDKGWTQEQLGSHFVTEDRPDGYGKQTVAAWESNRNDLTAENLTRLCQVFGVTSDYLLFGAPSAGLAQAEIPADDLARLVTRYVLADKIGRRLIMAAADSVDQAHAAADKSKSR